MGVGGAPPAGEAPAAKAAAERPVLPAETPAAEEARESKSMDLKTCTTLIKYMQVCSYAGLESVFPNYIFLI